MDELAVSVHWQTCCVSDDVYDLAEALMYKDRGEACVREEQCQRYDRNQPAIEDGAFSRQRSDDDVWKNDHIDSHD
jgi:hypothetical protein